MKALILFLLTLPAMAEDFDHGRFDPCTPYEPPVKHAPEHVSHMYAREIATVPDERSSVELPMSGDSPVIVWAAAPFELHPKPGKPIVVQPLRIDESDPEELGLAAGDHYLIDLMPQMAAMLRLDLTGPADTEGVVVAVAEPESAIELRTYAEPLSQKPGEPVRLSAKLFDDGEPITNAKVWAFLASPTGDTLERVDLSPTGERGVYCAVVPGVRGPTGQWQVRFEAEGKTRNIPFARTGFGEFFSEPGAASLDRAQDEPVEGAIRITAHITVKIPGTYRLAVIAVRGEMSVAWAELEDKRDVGPQRLTIDLPLSDVGSPENLMFDVRLLGLDPMGVAGRMIVK